MYTLSSIIIQIKEREDDTEHQGISLDQSQMGGSPRQVYVALGDGEGGETPTEVLAVNVEDLLNGTVTFICRDGQWPLNFDPKLWLNSVCRQRRVPHHNPHGRVPSLRSPQILWMDRWNPAWIHSFYQATDTSLVIFQGNINQSENIWPLTVAITRITFFNLSDIIVQYLWSYGIVWEGSMCV